MSKIEERIKKERRHLIKGPIPDEKPEGLGIVRFIVRCPANADQVLDKAKTVLLAVNQKSIGEWPSDEKWRELLPSSFVSNCGPELSPEEVEVETARWRKLSREEQIRWDEDHEWSLSNWVYWFEPGNRQWYWWDAAILDCDTLIVAVEVEAWPFPWGNLAWMFRASGAYKAEEEH